MHMKFSNLIHACLLACIAPITAKASAAHGSPYLQGRHAGLAKRVEGDMQLFNRGAGSRWTYYNVETGNAGSCGKANVNTDFTVAMNVAQMNPSWCFKTITMTYGGKTTTATITDTCPGCPYGGLDLTEGLFAFFLGYWPTAGGVLTGDWEFGDAVKVTPVITTPKATPTTTKAPVISIAPIISTSSKATVSSTTSSAKPSSSTKASLSATTSASATSTVNYLSGAASGLAVPTGTIDTAGGPSNLQGLTQVFIEIGGLAMAASAI